MTQKKVIAYLASLASAGISAAIAGYAFNAPSWAVFLTFIVAMGFNRVRDTLAGDA